VIPRPERRNCTGMDTIALGSGGAAEIVANLSTVPEADPAVAADAGAPAII